MPGRVTTRSASGSAIGSYHHCAIDGDTSETGIEAPAASPGKGRHRRYFPFLGWPLPHQPAWERSRLGIPHPRASPEDRAWVKPSTSNLLREQWFPQEIMMAPPSRSTPNPTSCHSLHGHQQLPATLCLCWMTVAAPNRLLCFYPSTSPHNLLLMEKSG